VLLCALLASACDAYDSSLLRAPNPSKPPAPDSGARPPSDADAGEGEDAGAQPCVAKSAEICNGKDDDCDGKTDENTQAYCESIILNAETQCAPVGDHAACVKLYCHDGFFDCDGKPQNGCEKPFCACHDCTDAGRESDGGS
jgi:hypothetical protein